MEQKKELGIIFDMDGTLWDSASQVARAWSGVTEPELGIKITKEDMYRCMGMPMDKLAMELLPGYSFDQLTPVLKKCEKAENDYLREHGAKLYPNLIQTLQTLAEDHPLFIVSNCQCGYIESFLEHYGLSDYFCDFVCFGDNGRSKGDNIALIIERNGLSRAVYVGDIQADYEAAMAAGAEFIHAAYGFGSIDKKVEAIREFSDLPHCIANLMEK